MEFDESFHALTDHTPFPWQRRLFAQWFAKGKIPPSCNLPTGTGKTSVIAVWLIALARKADMPRRLIYVVNRRTVVDQTTAEIERIRRNIGTTKIAGALRTVCHLTDDETALGISTLRGQFADNQEWSANPSRPAVVCGTVDMIGSRLLFSGYRIGFKSRPLHAGFLGQDTLLIHDEAHLEPAFQKLVETVQQEQNRCQDICPLHLMELTATSRASDGVFTLDQDDQRNATVRKRIEARKAMQLHAQVDRKKMANQIADLAIGYRDSHDAILVFVRTVEDVVTIRDKLHKAKLRVEALTGTLRGKERDELVKKPVFQRFLPYSVRMRDVDPIEGTAYLVCTSAGEVGIDISADHMVCDVSTFDSMAQRFGRVNRFGDRKDTRIDVVHPKTFDEKNSLTPVRQATLALLEELKGDASSQALAKFNAEQCKAAFAPEPNILLATDILFDAWALTSIRDKMPGRPPVEPYLHGVAEWEPPRTSVAWRYEVEYVTDELVKRHGPGFPQTLLDDYPLKPHELLNDSSERVLKSLRTIVKRNDESCPVWIINERGPVQVSSLRRLLDGRKKQVIERIRGCTILLPPAMGGLHSGMLDGTSEHANDIADLPEHPSERRIRILRIGSVEPDDTVETRDMRLVRSIELDPDEEDETLRRFWEWYKLKPLEDTRTAQKPVGLDTHVGDVEDHARRIVKGLSLPHGIADAVILAAKLHDQGKQRQRFQMALGNQHYHTLLLAKSGHKGARLPEPFRHEFASVGYALDDEEVQKLPSAMQDLVLHLIASHHGRARPHFPAEEAFDPGISENDAEILTVETPRRFARLQRQYGRWGLAYLESLLRAADWAASAEPSRFVAKTQEISP